MRERVSGRILPKWAKTVGGLIGRGAIVRLACYRCCEFFDVDLQAVARVRGEGHRLLDAEAVCRRSSCRGRSHFVAAEAFDAPFLLLVSLPDLHDAAWLDGLRPCDVDRPPDGGLPPFSPAPVAQPEPSARRA